MAMNLDLLRFTGVHIHHNGRLHVGSFFIPNNAQQKIEGGGPFKSCKVRLLDELDVYFL